MQRARELRLLVAADRTRYPSGNRIPDAGDLPALACPEPGSRPSLRIAIPCSECRYGRRPCSPPPGPPATAGSRQLVQIQTF